MIRNQDHLPGDFLNESSQQEQHAANAAAPLVSVIIPVYNGERFLAEAIRSVLDPVVPPDEIIVVDDGSTDGTATLVHSLGAGIRYCHQSNQGPAAARNLGLKMARGEIIAFQDADDVWVPGRLALQLDILTRHPAAHAVIGRTCFFYSDAPSPGRAGPMAGAMAPRWFLGVHTGLYRRSAFEIVGRFNAALRYHEDVDWFRRARAAAIDIHPHDDAVLLHRRHAADDSLLAWLTTRPAGCGRQERLSHA